MVRVEVPAVPSGESQSPKVRAAVEESRRSVVDVDIWLAEFEERERRRNAGEILLNPEYVERFDLVAEILKSGLARTEAEAEQLLKSDVEYSVFAVAWLDNGHNSDGYTLHLSRVQFDRYRDSRFKLRDDDGYTHRNGLSEPLDGTYRIAVDAGTFARVLNSPEGAHLTDDWIRIHCDGDQSGRKKTQALLGVSGGRW